MGFCYLLSPWEWMNEKECCRQNCHLASYVWGKTSLCNYSCFVLRQFLPLSVYSGRMAGAVQHTWHTEFYILLAELRFIFRFFSYFSSTPTREFLLSSATLKNKRSYGHGTEHRCTYVNVFPYWEIFSEHWLLQTVLWSSRSPTSNLHFTFILFISKKLHLL